MNGGSPTDGNNRVAEFLNAGNVDLARMDVDFRTDEVTVEASAKFNDTEALADAIGIEFGDAEVEHIYGEIDGGIAETFVSANEFVGPNPTETEVRERPQVGPETDVSLSSDLDGFSRLDTDAPRQHLGLTDGSTVADYTNEDGVVDTDGLRDAIRDWRNGDADTDLLRGAISAWRSGESVT